MAVTPAVIVTGSPGSPDNSLPGSPPGINNALPGIPGPVDPGYGIPLPPVTIWPIPPGINNGLPVPPTYPVSPDNSLPSPPSVWPNPPRPVLPPGVDNSLPVPISPSLPIYLPPPGANNELPIPPGSVYPPLPPSVPAGMIMVVVWIPGFGYRWTVLDTTLRPSHPIVPGVPPSIDNSLPGAPPTASQGPGMPTNPIAGPPTPEPKR